jgi:signal transduction histidine kinase
VTLEVQDAGPGIPADKLETVFNPFFTTKSEGMGMGLSICRSIIKAHHGEISATNAPGGGAIFRVVLPVIDSTADAI